MDSSQLGLFDLAERRLDWAAQRQTVLAANIANASTPGYQAKDLPPFAQALAQAGAATLRRTNPNHLALASAGRYRPKDDTTAARAPDGNDITLDVQLTRVADTETIQATVTAIYKKYISLLNLALGRGS